MKYHLGLNLTTSPKLFLLIHPRIRTFNVNNPIIKTAIRALDNFLVTQPIPFFIIFCLNRNA